MNNKPYPNEALAYHSHPPSGKIGTCLTKPLATPADLALAYTPGVAAPCHAIAQNPASVYDYTAKSHLVGIISNGSAVLGLGNIGPAAAKPVMEGKAALLKMLTGLDAFDLEIDEMDPKRLAHIIQALAPTFGAINLEDIKAPMCFIVEATLQAVLDIPVFHDDQHGTAIIVAAALQNALLLVQKNLPTIRLVINGAGAGALACAHLLHAMGLPKKQLIMLDSKGVIHENRQDLNPYKAVFTTNSAIFTLDQALQDADVLIGLSTGNVLTPTHLRSMAPQPIVFALANPTPEIDYHTAHSVRHDIIMGTGRSDYPNQVNNVLAFPYLLRGALDVRAKQINQAMKLAMVQALAHLAHTPVPKAVQADYRKTSLAFGPTYLIPKPTDPRLLTTLAPAVAKAAMASGVAQKPIKNWADYQVFLQQCVPKP